MHPKASTIVQTHPRRWLTLARLLLLISPLTIMPYIASCGGGGGGETDDSPPALQCTDRDNDGFGIGDTSACTSSAVDCDDGNRSRAPGLTEVCDGQDNDCDDLNDEGLSACGDNNDPTADSVSLQTDPSLPYLEKTLVATDPDGDVLTFELLSPDSGEGYLAAYIAPTAGVLYLTIVEGFTGQISLSYRVSDGMSFSPSATIAVSVLAEAPGNNALGSLDVTPEQYASFQVNRLSASVFGKPGGAPTRPPAIDLTDNFPLPGRQGDQSSCVGWATAYALKSYHERIEIGWPLNTLDHLFSPAFVYNQINGGVDRGSYIHDALDLIIREGAATLETMPYSEFDYHAQPSPSAQAEALNYLAVQRHRVDSVLAAKDALANRQPVVIGFTVYDSFHALQGPNSIYNTRFGQPGGGHAVTIIGYDDNRFGGAFRVINSWGRGWGDHGYFWLPYNFVPEVVTQMYILEDGENQNDPEPEDPTRPSPANLPNLQVKSWSANYDPRPRGEGVLRYDVINTGQATAPTGVAVNLMLSRDDKLITSDVYVVREDIPFPLDPGGGAIRDETNEIRFIFPDHLAPGDYHMAVWIDDINLVEESNEEDNVSLGSNLVTIETQLADLVVEYWFANWDGFGNGTLQYTIRNQGVGAVSRVDWYITLALSFDPIIGNGDDLLLFSEQGTHPIAPNGTVYRDLANPGYFNLFGTVFGQGVPPGVYYMGIIVDGRNVVDEANEINNASMGGSFVSIFFGGAAASSDATQEPSTLVELPNYMYNGRILGGEAKELEEVRQGDKEGAAAALELTPQKVGLPSEPLAPSKAIQSADFVVFTPGERRSMP